MRLGFRPPKDPEGFLAYARALAGRYAFIEVPGSAAPHLEGVAREARGMGYRLTYHARYLDLYPGSPVPEIREASLRLLREDLERAARMGAFLVNVHAGNLPWTDYPPPGLSPAHEALREAEGRLRREYLERALEALAGLASLALDLGLKLTLENLPAPQEVPRTPEEMALFLAVPGLEFCLDLGHAQMAGQDPKGFLEALGSRLVHVHAHRNDGRFDLHLPPRPEDLKPFLDTPCTLLVELPPRGVGEYLALVGDQP
ncbi:MAG: sugar phosphate isomerase/epimerase [Thermus sp.]|uniref:sugar phosphate isomerase/epimerase family protein n=1 Tax=Thermus sp. TaxID=275 RepID=UPI0025EFED59|nr:TIM barrel protein [Thermus sp.]MCS6869292.1 sugar phosphate isomerase/epimerase [Thermus sp.]MCS7219438.1 sugar phosphate isomerase/epimerase [Thermus sp.]MDW8018236.1 TIM barrel protein [Thermus sp.]MDW8358300.1 TIM barrel protein [Thermus sp.]